MTELKGDNMGRWKYKIELKDLHKQHRAGEITIRQVALQLANRMNKATELMPLLARDRFARVGLELRAVVNTDKYDECLERLYDLGDRWDCWINTF